MLSVSTAVLAVLVMAAVTLLTRAVPFLFFRGRKPPEVVTFIGKYMPPMVMTLLVMYALKDVAWSRMPYGLPEILAGSLVAVLHFWKRNALLSIFGGTIFYMYLVQSGLLLRLFSA